jgi:hypothetical protein
VLRDELETTWKALRATTLIDDTIRVGEARLTLGAGTALVADRDVAPDAVERGEQRLVALLTVAHRRPPSGPALAHVLKGYRRWLRGEDDLAAVHFAFSGLNRLRQPQTDAQRLFAADALLEAGLTPERLVRALDLTPADVEKYSPDQPRVPAGNGRPSGQWTADGGGAGASRATGASASPKATPRRLRAAGTKPAARSSPVPHVAPVKAAPRLTNTAPTRTPTMAAVGAAADATLDLGALSTANLARLADFLTGLGRTAGAIGTAAAAPLALGFGFALIPTTSLATGKWVKVGGPGDVSYLQPPDETDLHIQFTASSGERTSITADWDPGTKGYRNREGKMVARVVGGALVVSTAALGLDSDDPQLCPAQVPDRHGPNGLAYEEFVKRHVNPAHPTPSEMAYLYTNQATGNAAKIDDCKRETGFPFEAKGPGYASHLLKGDFLWQSMLAEMIPQGQRQIGASNGRPLTWYFDEKPAADFMAKAFAAKGMHITVEWLPMPRGGKK